jgi:amino acid adenylation domain-containing protein
VSQLVDYDPFAGAVLERTFTATDAQKEIWTATRLGDDASCAFNESVSLMLRGALDLAALRQAVGRLLRHHEALRATFSPADARMCVAASLVIDVPLEDLSGLPEPARDVRRSAILAGEVETPFDLEHGPLVRMRLLRFRPDHHVLTVTAHHIVCDGWSMAVLLRDLGHFYSGAALPAAQAFSAYARHVAGHEAQPAYRAADAYWRAQYERDVPALAWPLDHARPAIKTYRARRHDYPLDAGLVTELKRLGARHGASFFVTLLTAYVAFLHRLTGQRDLVVAIPTAGQAATEMPNLIGHCVNLLPIRCRIDPAEAFQAALANTRTQVLDAYEHQQMTFGRLLQTLRLPRDPSRLPLVSTVFNLDQEIQGNDLGFTGLDVQVYTNPRHFENAELSINAAESSGRVILECQYNTDLFDAATVCDRMQSFEALVRGVVADAKQDVARLPMLNRLQSERILVEWNASPRRYPRDRTLVQLLEEQAHRTPDRVAVVAGAETLTYAALHARANRLARHLQDIGARSGSLVGLCVERSADLLVGILGVLKTGAAYLPVEPSTPRQRLEMMLADAAISIVVAQDETALAQVREGRVVVCLDRDRSVIDALPAESPPCHAGPSDLAYVIYTSGSTGKPKGVAVMHGNVAHLLLTIAEQPGLGEEDVLVALASCAFDMSVPELLAPLTVGARVVIANREATSDGHQLVKLLADHQATIVQGTPATWRLLLSAGWQGSAAVTAWSGGEALSPDLVRDLLPRVRRLFNLYGPTETTCFCTVAELTDPECIHIGRPVSGAQAYVLDAQREPVPVGVPGELYVGGAGVALGYLHRPEQTAERFIENPYHDPFAEELNPRLYRTGDLARWRHDGTLEYLGRNDQQIKLRGHRIEPGEIEAALMRHSAVRAAAVVARADRPGDVRLVAYVVPTPGQTATATELRRGLREILPDYMIPQQIVEMDALPLTAHGKLDRARLPAPFAAAAPLTEAAPPATAAERYLAQLWEAALGLTAVGTGDNFFQLGGHSLLAFEMLARIEQETGVRLPPRALILNTLAQVAAQVPEDLVPSGEPRTLMSKLRGFFGS